MPEINKKFLIELEQSEVDALLAACAVTKVVMVGRLDKLPELMITVKLAEMMGTFSSDDLSTAGTKMFKAMRPKTSGMTEAEIEQFAAKELGEKVSKIINKFGG